MLGSEELTEEGVTTVINSPGKMETKINNYPAHI